MLKTVKKITYKWVIQLNIACILRFSIMNLTQHLKEPANDSDFDTCDEFIIEIKISTIEEKSYLQKKL